MAKRLKFTTDDWEECLDSSQYDNQENVYLINYQLSNLGIYVKNDLNDKDQFHWMVVRAKLKFYGWAIFGGTRTIALMILTAIVAFFVGRYLVDFFPLNN